MRSSGLDFALTQVAAGSRTGTRRNDSFLRALVKADTSLVGGQAVSVGNVETVGMLGTVTAAAVGPHLCTSNETAIDGQNRRRKEESNGKELHGFVLLLVDAIAGCLVC